MQKIRFPLCGLALVFLVSCTTFQQSKIANVTEFNIPKEIEDKFAVKDSVDAAPAKVAAPVSTPVAAANPKSKKKKAKLKQKAEKKSIPAEWQNRWAVPPMFKVGERYVFDITYFGAVAGELELKILPLKYIENRKVFHVHAAARTASIFSLFYRLNDVAESYIDADALFTYRFNMKLDESRQQRDLLELYDQKAHTMYFYSKLDRNDRPSQIDQLNASIEPFTQDSLSAFFFVRTLPLEIGKPYRFPVCTNGKMKTVQVTAVRKETLVTKKGEFQTIVVKPEVVLDGALQNKGDTFIWYSDDANRSILKIEAKIKVGSITAYLRELDDGIADNTPVAKP